jgi:hypothetical protein
MLTKTVRSRFSHEVGEKVEGCTILEREVIIPPVPAERRLGVYSYLVEVPPAPENHREKRSSAKSGSKAAAKQAVAGPSDYTRATPDERPGVIRRVPPR